MALDLTFVNAAATRTGNDTVTTLNNGTPIGNIAGSNYEQIVRDALTAYPWRWATKTKALVAIAGDPDPPWTYAYQVPNDLLLLRDVKVERASIHYEQQFNKILCDIDTGYEVIATYTWQVPESYWPADFAEAITQQLEALFLRGVKHDYEEAESRDKSARAKLAAARTNDAKKASARNPMRSPLLEARNGTAVTTALPWR